MKKTLILAAASLLLASCGNHRTPQLEDRQDTISWVMGQSMAESIKSTGVEVDADVVLRAVEATLNGEKQPLSQQTYQDVLYLLSAQIQMKQHQEAQQQAESTSKRQAEYFEHLMQEKPNLLKTPSGILYEPIKQGTGRKGKQGLVAVFHYRSFNAFSNEVYDQTYGNRDAIVHVIGSPMMPAMIEALTLMPAGSTYRFYFPYEATQGVQGIAPYTPLIYEIELLEIKD